MSVLQFYEDLAASYHLIFANWAETIERQANVLDRLIRAHGIAPPLDVLDCSCGIGTQAVGLAGRGYTVHATDLSPAAVARAADEAARRGVTLTTGVADFRTLAEQVAGAFDVVLSCDNAVPHLLTDADLRRAADNMRAKLRPGGLLLISLRDYDHLAMERPRSIQPRVYDDPAGQRVVFQVWDWAEDGQTLVVKMFILQQSGADWQLQHYTTPYRALLRADLNAALDAAGLVDLRWHMPQDTGYYQPVVTARAAG